MRKVINMYLHSSKESNSDVFIENFLDDDYDRYEEVPADFKYALYEVKFEVEVDTETGHIEILSVDAKKFEKNQQK